MRKPRELKVRCFMHFTETDRVVPLEELTPEEMEYCQKKMMERMSRAMSDYYANHPDHYELLLKSLEKSEREERSDTNAKREDDF